ncbi:ABC transporter substrate-binding protein [Cognatishimia sp. SS12]|uniref:ABC transporter substrate-binding protein n=1 Tax=Cognatishimia sp. SS12 TaxID=2979465 RepID=UPI002FEE556F
MLKTGAAAGLFAAAGLPLTAGPKRGGVLRLGLAGAHPTDSWDSRSHVDAFMIIAGHGAVFDTLTQVSATGELAGELAESWQAAPDAQSWVFKLRRDAEFHNGKPFVAEDVIASLRLHLDVSAASPARHIVASIAQMTAVSDHELRFDLTAPNADFPFLLSDYHLCIYPAGQIAEAMRQGIGTGLYKVIRFEPGQRALLARVSGHYKDGQAGWFDAVELHAMPDHAQRMAALSKGQVDAINQLAPGASDHISRTPALALAEVTGSQHFGLPMRSDIAPFYDPDVRRALKHAIDRPTFLDQVLGGHGAIAHDQPIGPANQFYLPELSGHSYDPEKARFLLRRAGLGGHRFELTLSEAAFPLPEAGVAQLKDAFAKAGVNVGFRQAQAPGYWAGAWGASPWRASRWSGRATEDWMFSASAQTGAAWNETHWDNARFQQMLLAARAELSTARRRALYHDMQVLMSQEGGALIPVFANFLDAHHTRLAHGPVLGNLHGMDSARLIERWWLKESA